MFINVLTIFPELINPVISWGVIKRALEKGTLTVQSTDIRDFTTDRRRSTDDAPYGGGPGMVMKPEPVITAIDFAKKNGENSRVVLMSPQGNRFSQSKARSLSRESHLIIVCGRYEGIDERIRYFVDDEISIGDYVLTGGELPALVLIDAVVRLIPGVLGNAASADEESFSGNLLEYPHYTRPPVFRGLPVPDVLLSGHHKKIQQWRKTMAVERTKKRHPELYRYFLEEKDRDA